MQRYYKGWAKDKPPAWELLPQNWQGYGYYAALPEIWGWHGHSARVTWCGTSLTVQALDVVRAGSDTRQFLNEGRVIDLGEESFAYLWAACHPGRSYRAENEGILDGVKVEVKQ